VTELRPLLDHVREARAVDLSGMDGGRLEAAVGQRMRVLGASAEDAYLDALRAEPAELGRLLDALLADRSTIDWSYDVYPRIEEPFLGALDESLGPRGPDVLYDVVGRIGLPRGAAVADVGCGEGRHTIPLAERFGFEVIGIDPVQRHLDLGGEALAAAAERDPALRERVRFARGGVEALPLSDGSVDLVWFRDVLEHVHRPDLAFAEIRRVLRDGGRSLVYSVFRTGPSRPELGVEWVWRTLGNAPDAGDPATVEAAIASAGLRVDERFDLGSEWGEWAEERAAAGTRRLLHAARLLRAPDRYVEAFGRAASDVMLADCLWHVYRMLGDLSGRVYVLSKR
jgi:SAM-dependent methyltransferase